MTSFDTYMLFGGGKKRYIEEDFSSSDEEQRHGCFRRSSSKKSKAIPYETMELEDKLTGAALEFNLYEDGDLPFLDPQRPGSHLIKQNMI